MTRLRPYQQRMIDDTRAHVVAGRRAPLLVVATGAGKTVIGAAIVAGHVARGGRVLWLAHRRELVEQAADRLESCGLTVGVMATGSRRANPYAQVSVASVQALRAREATPEATMLVLDEAHHHVAADWGELARAYAGSLRIGLTATPERGDGAGLGSVFDCIVPGPSIRQLTDDGHLVPLEVIDPGKTLGSREIARRPVDAWFEYAVGRSTLVFAPHVKAAREYLESFLETGITAGLLHSNTPIVERSSILREFAAGARQVVISVGVLTEGFDAPIASCAILARGCGSVGLYIQMTGRVLRPYPGKRDALLIDLRGVVHQHGRPDADREYSLDGAGIRRADGMPAGRCCQVCGAVIDADGQCPDCGRPGKEQESPVVVNVALQKYARIRSDSDEDRARRLAKWFAECDAKGHKRGSAGYRYSATYGGWPPPQIRREAERMVRYG